MSSIIIPSNIDETKVRVAAKFPLRAQGDSVVDADDRTILTIDDSIEIRESLKFAKLFAKAPEMFQLLRSCYGGLAVVAMNSEGFDHGSKDEKRDECLLCACEDLLESLLDDK